LTPALNYTPHHLILEGGDSRTSVNKVLHREPAIVEVIVDLILILIEELLSLGVIDEARDTSGAAVFGYVLDLICIGEASSESGVHVGHVVCEASERKCSL
jgi:hypothetical protein